MTDWRSLGSDLVVAGRRLRDAPGFTLISVLTLAIGIGGNTAVFTLIDRVLLQPLPVERPAELYRIGDTDACCVNSGLQGSFSLFSYDLYLQLRDAAPEFTHLAAFQANTRAITIGRDGDATPPETLNGAFVSGNYFQVFEQVPAAGRLLQPSDDQRGSTPAAVISHRAWTRRFAARSDIIGAAVTLNGVAATVVGVAPQTFYGDTLRPTPTEIWVPLSTEPLLQPAARLLEAKPAHWLYSIGRLRPGTPTAPIEARLTATLRNWLGSVPTLSAQEREQIPQQHITLISAAAGVRNVRDGVAPSLRLLQALAAALLLIACANLASLLLARGSARRVDTAVRVALGASRTRLVWQFLAESTLLACLGGIVGLVVSYAGAQAILTLAFRGAADIPVNPAPSLLTLGFAVAVSLVTGALFGAAPAIFGSRSDPADALRSTRSTGEHGRGIRGSLVVMQVAVTLMLVTCAGLLGRSLRNLETQDFGVRVDNRYVVNLAPSVTMVPPGELAAMYSRMQERLREIPGVVNAGFSLYAPMSGDNWSTRFRVEGRDEPEGVSASWNRVSAGYFDTVGTPVVRGRAFDERDRADSPLVGVITQSFAHRLFGDADPIGRRFGPGSPSIEIVGVVGDAKYQDGRRAARDMFFLPYLQQTTEQRAFAKTSGVALDRSHYPGAILINATGATTSLEGDVRRALAEVDRRITVRSMISMNEQVAGAFNIDRLIARLTLAFGGVALLLACLGLYGVTAYSVSRRTREIGLRMAIGAPRGRVLTTILRGAMWQVAVGAAIGVPLAVIAARLLQARLFGISPSDPAMFLLGIAVLTAAALCAALVPAAHAAGMDPVKALRVE